MAKVIFIAGGVMSGIGKGISTSSIGKLLKSKGYKVTAMKIDPYINVDAGTMNPVEHGEVFVTKDGGECDQDIGNYERFLNCDLAKKNYLTTGKVYSEVIKKERNLEYEGKCVEVVPDIPNEVIKRIKEAGKGFDFILVEIGGTIGEYQNLLFLEAARIMKLKNPSETLFILVSYLPILKKLGEMKTKPTQTASRKLNESGILPDFIIGRAEKPLDKPRKRKISNFCNIGEEDVISLPDAKSIYEVPLKLEKEGLGDKILKKLNLENRNSDLEGWEKFSKEPKGKEVKIGVVGKYFESGQFILIDSYISVLEAIKHATRELGYKEKIEWLSAEEFEKERPLSDLKEYDGIIVPGGFGSRGIEGKIKVIGYCRENNIPFLGLCLGMQLAIVEFSRNVCNLKKAYSAEFNPKCQEPVIALMEGQKKALKSRGFGGTMRLGEYACKLKKGSLSHKAYKKEIVFERHRHRYEVNNKYIDLLEKNDLSLAGINPDSNLVEIMELPNHPFFLGVQFHPEFKSRPEKPHPLFVKFLSAN